MIHMLVFISTQTEHLVAIWILSLSHVYHIIRSFQIRSNSTLFSALHSQGAKRTWLEGYRKLKKVQQHQVKAKRSVLAWPDVGQW